MRREPPTRDPHLVGVEPAQLSTAWVRQVVQRPGLQQASHVVAGEGHGGLQQLAAGPAALLHLERKLQKKANQN